jgi:hypothetical protein
MFKKSFIVLSHFANERNIRHGSFPVKSKLTKKMYVQSSPDHSIITRLYVMGGTNAQLPIGGQVSLPGHFDLPVVLESACPVPQGFECRVRLPDGTLKETTIPSFA